MISSARSFSNFSITTLRKGKRLGRPRVVVDAARIAALRAHGHTGARGAKSLQRWPLARAPRNGRFAACPKTFGLNTRRDRGSFNRSSDQPAFDFPEVPDAHCQVDTPIGAFFNFLVRMPSAFLNVRRLLTRETDFHFLWLTPDQIERSLSELVEVKIIGNFKIFDLWPLPMQFSRRRTPLFCLTCRT